VGGVRQTGMISVMTDDAGVQQIYLNPYWNGAMATGLVYTGGGELLRFNDRGHYIETLTQADWKWIMSGTQFERLEVKGEFHKGWLYYLNRRVFFIPQDNGRMATGVISTLEHGVQRFTDDGFWVENLSAAPGWKPSPHAEFGYYYLSETERHTGRMYAEIAGQVLRLLFVPIEGDLRGHVATGVVAIEGFETAYYNAVTGALEPDAVVVWDVDTDTLTVDGAAYSGTVWTADGRFEYADGVLVE